MKINRTHNSKLKAKITMKKSLLICLLWGLTLTMASAAPLGTAFTYSGRLKYLGQPANTNFDLLVTNFDAAIGGNAVGNPNQNSLNGLACVNGLFVTNMNFGAVFDGNAYWLEIWARPTPNNNQNPQPYQKLSPRQPISPSPNALFASNAVTAITAATATTANSANTATTATTAATATTATTATTANGVSAGAVGTLGLQDNSVTAGKIAAQQVVKKLNGLSDIVTLAEGANVTFTTNANNNTLTIAASGGGSGWSLTGNAGTTAGVNFLGTTDGQPLEFKTANARALRLEYVFDGGGSSINTIGGLGVNRVFNGAIGATIAGGGQATGFGDSPNEVGANFGAIGGGLFNSVGGAYGTIPGGYNNEANGEGSFAAGRNSHAIHVGSFVWGDGTGQALSRGPNRFDVRATGGASFYTGGNYMRFVSPSLQVSGLNGEEAYLGGDGVDEVLVGSFNPAVVTVALYNAGNNTYMNLVANTAYVIGEANVQFLTIRGGADLAEPFQMSGGNISEGSVVVIDEEWPGELKLSTQPYDTHVAGIVSGANGIHPGISLRQEGKLDGGRDVALSGRVYVLADASHAPIKPGDLLTTSGTPGHAMKVKDHTRSQGAILGKAMSALAEGKGMVLVLVTLQ